MASTALLEIKLQSSGNSFAFQTALRTGAWIILVGLIMAAVFFTYSWSKRNGYAGLNALSSHELDIYVAGLDSELGKYEYLPGVVELDSDVLSLMASPSEKSHLGKVNQRLTNLNVRAGSLAIFLLDLSGTARASSNWYQPASFVGKNFSSLPYFSDAVQGNQVSFFSHSETLRSPEYNFMHPIRKNGLIIGLTVVKISLEPIEANWTASITHSDSKKLLVIDENDVIVMSSVQQWKHQKTPILSAMLNAKLDRQASSPERIEPLGMLIERPLEDGTHLLRQLAVAEDSPGIHYVTQERFMSRPGWRLVTLSSASDVIRNAQSAAFAAGAVASLISLIGMYLAQRRRAIANQLAARAQLQRAHDELESRIIERTAELHHANQNLMLEVSERKRTEEILREAQDELIQASKLALLGQMAAGITHEINQPLTALRSLSHNTRLLLQRGRTERIDQNLLAISDITERIGRITEQLKSFARKAPLAITPVDLSRSVDNALLLLASRIRSEHVEVKREVDKSFLVLCDGNRLEQVLINLIANALDAMQNVQPRVLTIYARPHDERILIRITDTGPGIAEPVLSRLFEPFFSTKPPGKGLGLGLVISAGIVREFGDALRAENTGSGGAAFEFSLKIAEEVSHV